MSFDYETTKARLYISKSGETVGLSAFAKNDPYDYDQWVVSPQGEDAFNLYVYHKRGKTRCEYKHIGKSWIFVERYIQVQLNRYA